MILDMLSHVVFGLVILATVVVRLTPTKSDDEKLDKIVKKIHSFFALLPTIGLNPKTKQMQDWYEENKSK